MSTVVGPITLLVTVVLLVAVGLGHARRPNAASRCWLIGIAMYAAGIGCQVYAEQFGITEIVYRLWYLCGAFFAAAYLGVGSLFRVASADRAGWALRGLAWASLLVAPIVWTVPVDLSSIDPRLLTGDGFPPYVRAITPAFNVFGTIALVGCAMWGAIRLVRAHGRGARVISLVAIAAGALVIASGGTLHRLGFAVAFYPSQLLGIVLIGLGVAVGFGGTRVAK